MYNADYQGLLFIRLLPEGVQRLLKGELKRFSFFVKSFLGCYCSAIGIKNTATQSYIRLW